MTMQGADADGLERAGLKCLDGANVASQVRQLLEGVVAALSAMSFFAGPWVAPIIAFLTGVVIPWLRNVEQALRSFGNVLSGQANAQRRVSEGLPVDFSRLPTYTPLGETPPATPPDPGGTDPIDPPGLPPSLPGPTTGPAPFDPAATPGGPRGREAGGGGGGLPAYSAAPLSGLDTAGPDLAGPDGSTIPTDPTLAPGTNPAPAAPVRRTGLSSGLSAGLAAGVVGGGLLGGAATYAAVRRRRNDTDGSELLGSPTVDRVGERHPDTVTAEDMPGSETAAADRPGPESSRSGDPVADSPGRHPGAST
jgi:hypothetical protein